MFFSMTLKINIRALRKAKGLTIAELADVIGISTAHLSQVERGTKNLNNHLLTRISSALGVLPEDLLDSDFDDQGAKRLREIVSQLSPEDQERLRVFGEALLVTYAKNSSQ